MQVHPMRILSAALDHVPLDAVPHIDRRIRNGAEGCNHRKDDKGDDQAIFYGRRAPFVAPQLQ